MSSSAHNRGLSIVEVLIATFLVMMGVMALMTMQPQGWFLSGKSDSIGRAGEVLHEQLETVEGIIMNPCNTNMPSPPWPVSGEAIPTNQDGEITRTETKRVSGMTSDQPGDMSFTVTTNIKCISTAPYLWRIKVVVTWPNATGIQESTLARRQDAFKQGC